MAARITRWVVFVLTVLVLGTPLSVGGWEDVTGLFRSIPRDIKRRQCWPEPFNAPDRVATRAPFATMVSNGWRRQNMLGNQYFEPKTAKLNEAGMLKVRWIVLESPQQHRIVYVHIGDTEELTSARLAAVQEQVAQLAPQGSPVPVLPTAISDEGWPADEVEMLTRSYQRSMPIPRLPAAKDSSSTGNSN